MQTIHRTSLGLKAIALAAGLAFAHVHATAQTVISIGIGQQSVVTDPLGSGRSALITTVAASSTTDFANGAFAVTNNPFTIGGTIAFLNVSNLLVGGVGGTTISQRTLVDEFGDTIRTNLGTSAGVSQFSAVIEGPSAGAIQVVSVNGGMALSGTRISGTLTGGDLQISNVRVGVAGGQVIADMSGTKAAVGTKPAVVYNSPNTVLWTFNPVADVTGPTQLKAASFLAADPVAELTADGYTNVHYTGTNTQGFADIEATLGTQMNNLAITSAGATFFINSLGLLATGQDALNAVNSSKGKWGSISTALTFTTSLPEPSTYVCMGLGLVGIALAARRNKTKQPI